MRRTLATARKESVPPGRLDDLAGRAASPGGGETRDIEAPFTGETIGSVPDATPSDVRAAIETARAARRDWAERPVDERTAVLESVQRRALARREELMDLIQLEAGKARRDALEEVLDVAAAARYYAGRAGGLLGSERRRAAFPGASRVEEHREPAGVVGLITPWNYPLTLTLTEALPALVAGNAVVLKPAPTTPNAALLADELLEAAGLPSGCFRVVPGDGATLGPALIDGVDHVGFTGSTETGRSVAERAGRALTDATLELGGKNPLLVLPDADIDRAVRGAIDACFPSAGQVCIAAERLYVHRSVYDRFRDRFVKRVRGLRLGTTFDYRPDLGSLAGADQLEKTESHVADAVEAGADCLTGGRARPDVGPYFHEPTVLEGLTAGMRAAEEETFGPVVGLYRVDSVDEAVHRANDSDYGLHASVWTGDPARGRRVARRIEAGSVSVNDPYQAMWGAVDAPMGGVKDSGIGRRHGRQGLERYTESRTVATGRVPLSAPRGRATGWYERAAVFGLRALRRLPGEW